MTEPEQDLLAYLRQRDARRRRNWWWAAYGAFCVALVAALIVFGLVLPEMARERKEKDSTDRVNVLVCQMAGRTDCD